MQVWQACQDFGLEQTQKVKGARTGVYLDTTTGARLWRSPAAAQQMGERSGQN